MRIANRHSRSLRATPGEVGALIDSLASIHDRLWPTAKWPPMTFDRPLGVGAVGGHGPIRYTVTGYIPGQWLRCRFSAPRGADGFHEFSMRPDGVGSCELSHLLVITAHGPARFSWPFLIKHLHDALLEDCLDTAERALTGRMRSPARWNPYVRLIRALDLSSRRQRA